MTAPSIPSAGRARATGSEASDDVRVASFGSEQSRPTSTGSLPLPRPRPPGGQRPRAQHGPTFPPLVAAGRWGIEVRRGGTLSSCWVGLPLSAGAARRGTGAARGPSKGGAAGLGGGLIAGHYARQAAHCPLARRVRRIYGAMLLGRCLTRRLLGRDTWVDREYSVSTRENGGGIRCCEEPRLGKGHGALPFLAQSAV